MFNISRIIEPIVMLTEHDLTVANGVEIFEICKDIPIRNWGFKSVGQPMEKLYEIAKVIKDAGKKLHLEVITFTQEEYNRVAEFCASAGVDLLLGTVYDKGLHEKLRECGTEYWPFVGKTPGIPGRIIKPMDEIIKDAQFAAMMEVDGVSCPAYMHSEYTGEEIVAAIHNAVPDTPVMVAGRVVCRDQMEALISAGAALFTIGGALFSNNFVPEGGFRANTQKLDSIIDEMTRIVAKRKNV